MTTAERKELDCIIAELQKITKELNNVSTDINSKFSGIGEERYAKKLDEIKKYYTKLMNDLAGMNKETVMIPEEEPEEPESMENTAVAAEDKNTKGNTAVNSTVAKLKNIFSFLGL